MNLRVKHGLKIIKCNYLAVYLVGGKLLPDNPGWSVEGEVDLDRGEVHLLQTVGLDKNFKNDNNS